MLVDIMTSLSPNGRHTESIILDVMIFTKRQKTTKTSSKIVKMTKEARVIKQKEKLQQEDDIPDMNIKS